MYETLKFKEAVNECVDLLCKYSMDADWIKTASEEDLAGMKALINVKETFLEMLEAKDKKIEDLTKMVSGLESKLDAISEK